MVGGRPDRSSHPAHGRRGHQAGGRSPDAVTVTHPANWGPYKTDLLRQTLRAADLSDARLLAEPEAAAVHYASTERLEPGEVVAIYDLGGGTFDSAALRRTDTGFELLGLAEGIERLGGIDFDEAVLAHVVSFLGPALDELDPDDSATLSAVARLRAECVAAKEGLSDDTEVSIPVLLPTLQTQIRLTRAEFEDMVRPTLAETTAVLSRTLRSGAVENDEVKAVLLVGGSSRIPLVGQMVAAEMNRPVAIDVHPKHAVALGAALDAARVEAPAPVQAPTPTRPAPPPASVPQSPPAPDSGARARRSPVVVGAAAALVVVVIAVGLFLTTRGGSDEEPVVAPEVPTFDVADGFDSVASGAGSLWLANSNGVTRFDTATYQVTQALRVGAVGNTRRVAFGAGSVWVTDKEASTLFRIDPATNAIASNVSLGGQPNDVIFATGAVWVTLPDDGVVVRVDPQTGAPTRILVRGQPTALAFGSGTLWVSDPGSTSLVRVDPVKLLVVGDSATAGCSGLVTADDSSVWVQGECGTDTVVRIDPTSGQPVGSVKVGRDAKAMVPHGGSLWVANGTDNTVTEVDVATTSSKRTIRVGRSPAALVVAGNTVWVSNSGDNTVSPIDA